jgi:hypothetical protein
MDLVFLCLSMYLVAIHANLHNQTVLRLVYPVWYSIMNVKGGIKRYAMQVLSEKSLQTFALPFSFVPQVLMLGSYAAGYEPDVRRILCILPERLQYE